MSQMYFVKTPCKLANLKVINDDGKELSLSGDDSCGTMENYSRLCMATFSGEDRGEMIGEEVFWPDPEDFMKELAAHLGYKVEKI